MKKIKNFNEKPIHAVWGALDNADDFRIFLKKVFKNADTICLTYNKDYNDFIKSEWSFLKDSIMDYEYTRETAVTIGPNVMLVYLKNNKTTREWLLGKNGISDFYPTVSASTRLDDLCFAKNGEVVFCSCTHEEFCCISEKFEALLEKERIY